MLSLLDLFESDFRSILELVFGVSPGLLEESIINIGIDSVKGDLGGGGNDVSRVDSAEGDSIDGVGSSDEEAA